MIRVRITVDGKIEISVNGVKGSSCIDITCFLEETLGQEVDRQFTTEYFESENREDIETTN